MRTVTVTEAKNGLSALIDAVQGGETILIVDRGRPVARLDSAVSAAKDDPDGRLARLERAGIIRRARSSPTDLLPLSDLPLPKPSASVLEALLEERRTGR